MFASLRIFVVLATISKAQETCNLIQGVTDNLDASISLGTSQTYQALFVPDTGFKLEFSLNGTAAAELLVRVIAGAAELSSNSKQACGEHNYTVWSEAETISVPSSVLTNTITLEVIDNVTRYTIDVSYMCGCPSMNTSACGSGCSPCDASCSAGTGLVEQTCETQQIQSSVCADCASQEYTKDNTCAKCTTCNVWQDTTADCSSSQDTVCTDTPERKAMLDLLTSSSAPAQEWSESSDHCGWTGVTCTGRNVTGLTLSAGLAMLPSSIAQLTHLKALDLKSNALTSLPAALYMLPLETLDLSDNKLRQLPSNVFEMSTLTSFKIADNELSGTVEGLNTGTLASSNLTVLDLSANYLQGNYKNLASFPKLTTLKLEQSTGYRFSCDYSEAVGGFMPASCAQCSVPVVSPEQNVIEFPPPAAASSFGDETRYSCNSQYLTLDSSDVFALKCQNSTATPYICESQQPCSCFALSKVLFVKTLDLLNVLPVNVTQQQTALENAVRATLCASFTCDITISDIKLRIFSKSRRDGIGSTELQLTVSASTIGPAPLRHDAKTLSEQLAALQADQSELRTRLLTVFPNLLTVIVTDVTPPTTTTVTTTTAPTEGPSSSSSSSDSGGLAVVLGALVGLLAIIVLVLVVLLYRRKHRVADGRKPQDYVNPATNERVSRTFVKNPAFEHQDDKSSLSIDGVVDSSTDAPFLINTFGASESDTDGNKRPPSSASGNVVLDLDIVQEERETEDYEENQNQQSPAENQVAVVAETVDGYSQLPERSAPARQSIARDPAQRERARLAREAALRAAAQKREQNIQRPRDWDFNLCVKWLRVSGFDDFVDTFYNNGFEGKHLVMLQVASFAGMALHSTARVTELINAIAQLKRIGYWIPPEEQVEHAIAPLEDANFQSGPPLPLRPEDARKAAESPTHSKVLDVTGTLQAESSDSDLQMSRRHEELRINYLLMKNLTREESSQLLSGGVQGEFVFRPSKSMPGSSVLSMFCNGMLHHFQISKGPNDTVVTSNGQSFQNLMALVDFFKTHDQEGLPCKLAFACRKCDHEITFPSGDDSGDELRDNDTGEAFGFGEETYDAVEVTQQQAAQLASLARKNSSVSLAGGNTSTSHVHKS